MIRAAAALALGLLLPAAAQAYVVDWSGAAVGERPSALAARTLPVSWLAPAPAEAGLAETGTAGALAPGGAASELVSVLRPAANFPVSHLAPAQPAGGLAPAGLASITRLAEVDSGLRARTDELLARFGAREENGRIIVSLPGDVLFDFDRAEIRPDAEPVLSQLAEILAAFPDAPVVIAGHTDAKGSDDYNLALSGRRADSVLAWLSAQGVAPDRMSTEAFGESQPVAQNTHADGSDDPAGRQLNRRVEFAILQPEN